METRRMKKPKKNYINNADFFAAIVDYQQKRKKAEEEGNEIPKMPNYLGECFMKLARGIMSRPNFASYPYREEMILDSTERCIRYIMTFKPEKTDRAFSFFSRVIWNAAINRISYERKIQYERSKMMLDQSHSAMVYEEQFLGGSQTPKHLEHLEEFIETYEALEKIRIAKAKERKLERESLSETPSSS